MKDISLSYTLPWLFVTFFFLLVAWKEYNGNSSRNSINLICAVVFLFFFGLRGFVGWDYASYYPLYKDSASLFDNGSLIYKINNIGVESGYSLYMIICKTISSNYHLFIFVSTLIDIIIIKNLFGRYSVNIGLSYALFIIFSASIEIDLLRNIKGLLFFYMALPYIYERKPLKYFAFITFGMFFHFTLIFCFPLYFFLHKKPSQTLMLILFIIGNILYLSNTYFVTTILDKILNLIGGDFFNNKSASYFGNEVLRRRWGVSFGFIERTVTWIILLSLNKKILKRRPESVLFVNSMLIFLMCYFLLADMRVILQRAYFIFSFSYWLMYPYFFEEIMLNTKKYVKQLFTIGITGYCLIKCLSMTGIMSRYENIIFNNTSFEKSMKNTEHARLSYLDDIFNQ